MLLSPVYTQQQSRMAAKKRTNVHIFKFLIQYLFRDECERCVNKGPFHCHPVRALRIYRCTEQNGFGRKKERENKKKRRKRK